FVFVAGSGGEEHVVAGLQLHGQAGAVFFLLAGADGDDFAALRLVLGGVRQDDAAGRLLLGGLPANDDAVPDWLEPHRDLSGGVRCISSKSRAQEGCEAEVLVATAVRAA